MRGKIEAETTELMLRWSDPKKRASVHDLRKARQRRRKSWESEWSDPYRALALMYETYGDPTMRDAIDVFRAYGLDKKDWKRKLDRDIVEMRDEEIGRRVETELERLQAEDEPPSRRRACRRVTAAIDGGEGNDWESAVKQVERSYIRYMQKQKALIEREPSWIVGSDQPGYIGYTQIEVVFDPVSDPSTGRLLEPGWVHSVPNTTALRKLISNNPFVFKFEPYGQAGGQPTNQDIREES